MARRRVPDDKRQRTAHACEMCKKRKHKCDGSSPCSACVKKHLDCFYLPFGFTQGAATQANNTMSQDVVSTEPKHKKPASFQEEEGAPQQVSSTIDQDVLDARLNLRFATGMYNVLDKKQTPAGSGEALNQLLAGNTMYDLRERCEDPDDVHSMRKKSENSLCIPISNISSLLRWVRTLMEQTAGPSAFTADVSNAIAENFNFLPSKPFALPVSDETQRENAESGLPDHFRMRSFHYHSIVFLSRDSFTTVLMNTFVRDEFPSELEIFARSCLKASLKLLSEVKSAYQSCMQTRCDPYALYFLFTGALTVLCNESAGLFKTSGAADEIDHAIVLLESWSPTNPSASRIESMLKKFRLMVTEKRLGALRKSPSDMQADLVNNPIVDISHTVRDEHQAQYFNSRSQLSTIPNQNVGAGGLHLDTLGPISTASAHPSDSSMSSFGSEQYRDLYVPDSEAKRSRIQCNMGYKSIYDTWALFPLADEGMLVSQSDMVCFSTPTVRYPSSIQNGSNDFAYSGGLEVPAEWYPELAANKGYQ